MDSEKELSMPLIHNHPLMPWKNDMRKGDCCGHFEAVTDGFSCKICKLFFHRKCSHDSSRSIQHPSHPDHSLRLVSLPYRYCKLCGKIMSDVFYNCENHYVSGFNICLCCAKYPPPMVIEGMHHHHKLTLFTEQPLPSFFGYKFQCAKCGCDGAGFRYRCDECDMAFHVDCLWQRPELDHYPSELNHSFHSLHPLKLHITCQLPDYSDGRCSLCLTKVDDRLFYHCSLCNFTLDMRCVLHPPLQSLLHLKAHDHPLTLLPRHDPFICDACWLKGDLSRYICFQCGFTIHQDCLTLPCVININRHDHRFSRTPLLGTVNSVCGVCHRKVDWTYGGFCCQKCPNYVVHSMCATRGDVWNGKELEGIPEETEDIEPYVIINAKTIQHFSHKEHHLRLHDNDDLCDDNKRCRACNHTICLQSFYSCIECDFILHQNCAEFPRMKRHFLHKERLTLVTEVDDFFWCFGCKKMCNGFMYEDRYLARGFDVQCVSISEPFVHSTHDHPLYYASPYDEGKKRCNNCDKPDWTLLKCIEGDCGFVLCFHCVTLPLMVKHRVHDHPLSLCYGEEEESGEYWCDICEKELNPKEWFYTCKDQRASLHTRCVLGDFSNLMPGSTIRTNMGPETDMVSGMYLGSTTDVASNMVVLNNSVSRPICSKCKCRCIYPIITKNLEENAYYCSKECIGYVYDEFIRRGGTLGSSLQQG